MSQINIILSSRVIGVQLDELNEKQLISLAGGSSNE